jgi:hypothetical protein
MADANENDPNEQPKIMPKPGPFDPCPEYDWGRGVRISPHPKRRPGAPQPIADGAEGTGYHD